MGRDCLIFVALSMLTLSGCFLSEYLFTEMGTSPENFINYALESNGAKVRVSEDNPYHPASTLINGVKDSNLWDQGEGWELEYRVQFLRRDRRPLGSDSPAVISLGWVIIDLPEPKMINRILIYTINSKEYPASRYGVKSLIVQYKPYNPKIPNPGWFAIERTDRTLGQPLDGIRNNKSGVIDLKFKPVYTKSVMITIQNTNDMKIARDAWESYLTGKIRLLEIEIYGIERKAKEELF